MELTRRDALVAAVGAGAGLSGGAVLAAEQSERSETPSVTASAATATAEPGSEGDHDRSSISTTFVAVARAIYPSGIDGIESFVGTYLAERSEDRTSRAAKETARELDALADGYHDASIATLDPEAVERLLREIGADTASADPSGTIAQRVRYHVVNELQYALYASPTGGALVGIENPIGHSGGIASYQRGPSA